MSMLAMSFLAPYWWLLAVLALLPWLGPWAGRDRMQNVLRSVLFVCLAAALSQPSLQRDDDATARVVILDRSSSVESGAQATALQQAIDALDELPDSSHHLIVLGELSDDERATAKKAFDSVTRLQADGPEGTTPLSAAISHAVTLIPRSSHGGITIFSDGLSTRPDDARAIATALTRHVPIDVVPLPTIAIAPTPVALTWDDELRLGKTATLTATIVSGRPGVSGQVILKANGGDLASAPYTGGSRSKVQLEYEPTESGFIDAEVTVATDNGTADRTMKVVLPVQEPQRIAYLGTLQKNGAEQLAKVLGNGFAVSDVDSSNADSVREALSKSDLVLMDDFQAESLPESIESQIVRAVTDEGLGLVMSGGRASFGSGGWHDRPIESLLPVELVQKEEKRDPSTSLVVVIDTSGSMSGVRVQLAKEVARLAMRRLLPHDKVGIVEFYGAKRWAAPLQPASNAIELQRALNRMDAGGGTVILPALEEAFYGLQNVDTRYKHVLVLTDGGVESGDFESLMRRMAGEGINVSTVLAGGGYHSEFLVNIANWGKGRFYNVPNRFSLPEILLKQPSTAKLPAYRPGTHRVRARGGAGWWGDVDTRTIPMLGGYVEAKARPGSEVLLETEADSHPVLATWRYGLGRVTTLGTEPVGEGTLPWRDWDDYGKALARIMERSAADTRDPFRFESVHDAGKVLVHAIRQRPRMGTARNALPVGRQPATQGNENNELHFVARSPDRFVATTVDPGIGETLRIECTANTTPDRWQKLAVASSVAAEDRVDPHRGINLQRLAQVAGGSVVALGGAPTTTQLQTGGIRLLSLSPWLYGLALLVFMAEVLWRRRPLHTGQFTD